MQAATLNNSERRDPFGPLKFLELDYWLRTNAQHVVRLGLVGQPTLRVLDLGTGIALFPFLCRLCGHRAEALDRPIDALDPEERLVYGMATQLLGVHPIPQRIEAYTPLTIDGTYDLITAFMVCFNQHKQPGEWGRSEWAFFLTDVQARLRPGGRLFLRLNDHSAKYGRLRYFDPDLRALFAAVGDVDDEGTVMVYRDRLDAWLGRNAGASI